MDLPHRPSRKAKKPAPTLGPGSAPRSRSSQATPEPRPPTAHHLVVCGASNPETDGWMFGDFLGICTYLTNCGIEGDFLSCFDLEAHFDFLESEGAQPIVKFGTMRDTKTSFVHYSKHEHNHGRKFFMDIKPDQLLSRISQWISRVSDKAQPGDTVDIWFLCHGAQSSGLLIGDKFLSAPVLQNATSHLRPGVQLNMSFSACYSGQFAECFEQADKGDTYLQTSAAKDELAWSMRPSSSMRIRNGRFTQALCGSLAGINVPSHQRQRWTLANHELLIKEQVKRKVTPREGTSNPQFYHGGVTLRDRVHEVLFRNHVDVVYKRENTARRNRTEWPVFNTNPSNQAMPNINIVHSYHPSTAAKQDAANLLRAVSAGCPGMPPYGFDGKIIRIASKAVHNVKDADLNEVLFCIYYRGRIQSALLDVVEQLHMRGVIDKIVALAEPIFAYPWDRSAVTLAGYLSCFEFCHQTEVDALRIREIQTCVQQYLDYALYWLAVVILRGRTSRVQDLGEMFHEIELTDFLGKLRKEDFIMFSKRKHDINASRDPMRGNHGAHRMGSIVGWFLPDGIPAPRADDFEGTYAQWHDGHATVLRRFDRIECTVKEYFGWDDRQVLLARDQVEAFRRNPTPGQME